MGIAYEARVGRGGWTRWRRNTHNSAFQSMVNENVQEKAQVQYESRKSKRLHGTDTERKTVRTSRALVPRPRTILRRFDRFAALLHRL